jgi:hypothetical protein
MCYLILFRLYQETSKKNTTLIILFLCTSYYYKICWTKWLGSLLTDLPLDIINCHTDQTHHSDPQLLRQIHRQCRHQFQHTYHFAIQPCEY